MNDRREILVNTKRMKDADGKRSARCTARRPNARGEQMRQGFNNLSAEIYTNCLYGHEPLDVELLVDATGSAEADAFFPVRV